MTEPADDPLEPTEGGEAGQGDGPVVPETVAGSGVGTHDGTLIDPGAGDARDLERTKAIEVGPERTVDFSGEEDFNPPPGAKVRYLGDYELLGVLGRGGMGVVYRARQISLNREVALKLIRSEGLSTESERRRFQHEAEAVASLDHPGIVPIYEVGTHERRHYFSMKLIEGPNLQRATPSLRGDFRAIGRIVASSARAVQHAHERGLLHRDIKPGNILLDEVRAPHLTDFGLAKRVDANDADSTRTDAILGTPAYMAPEQATAARGAITTATDIYGLGSVLYVLLSGHAPHRGSSVLEVLDAVRQEAPEPPSKDDPTIPRDLEVICLKCLEKDPRRRYHSAEALADDLDRWLSGRPIAARKVGPAARGVMWCRRNPLVAGLAAALLVSALVGSAGILINWREARRRGDELARANLQIRSEWRTSRTLNEFLISDLLEWSSPFLAGRRDVPVSKLLDRSASLASPRFANHPKIEGSIRQALGTGYLALGLLPKAEVELIESSKLRATLPEGDEPDRLSSEYFLARLRIDQGRFDDAEAHASRAFEGRRRWLGEEDEATIEASELLGVVLKMKGRDGEARQHLEATAALALRALGADHRVTLRVMTDLAIVAYDQGRFAEALAGFDEVAVANARAFGPDHPDTLLARSKRGATLVNLGDDARAEEILAACLEPAREVLGPDHPETLRIGGNLAAARAKLGKDAEAAREIDETLKAQRVVLPADHAALFSTEINRAVVLLRQQRPAEAEPILRELIPRMRSALGPADPMLGQVLGIRAGALWDQERTVEAEPLFLEGAEIYRKTMPPEDPRVVGMEAARAAMLLANGKSAEAESLATRIVAIRSRPGAVDSPWKFGIIRNVLGGALAARNEFEEAEPNLVEGYRTVEDDPKAPPVQLAYALDRVIRFYESRQEPYELAKWQARKVAKPVQ